MTHLHSTQGYVPGGRWERILRLIRSRPMNRAEVLDALRTDETVLKIERRKIHFALTEMMRRDLIAWTPLGFVATANGVVELDLGDDGSRSVVPQPSATAAIHIRLGHLREATR